MNCLLLATGLVGPAINLISYQTPFCSEPLFCEQRFVRAQNSTIWNTEEKPWHSSHLTGWKNVENFSWQFQSTTKELLRWDEGLVDQSMIFFWFQHATGLIWGFFHFLQLMDIHQSLSFRSSIILIQQKKVQNYFLKLSTSDVFDCVIWSFLFFN